jgi:hypothetical protein
MVGAGHAQQGRTADGVWTVTGAAATGSTPQLALVRWGKRALGALENDRVCWTVLGVAMVAYVVLAMWLVRGTTLFVDGVKLFLNSRGLDAGALFAPLNGHLVLMERSVYAAGFALFGAGSIAFRIVEAVGALLAVGVLFEFLRRRVGGALALAPAVLILFLGTAWEVTIVPDVMTNTFCAAAGLGAFLALDRRDRRGDVAACLLLVAAICCWTLGAAFAVGAGVRIALEGRWRRLWVVAVPLVLYAVWLLWVRLYYVPAHGEDQTVAASNVLLIPNFLANEAATVVSAVLGLGYSFGSTDPFKVFETDPSNGYVIVVVAVAAIAVAIRRRGGSPMLWGALVALVAFWITLALGFGLGRSPLTARYVYPGAVLVFAFVGEALRGIRVSHAVLIGIFALTVLALGANIERLRDGASFFRSYSSSQRAQFTAMEIAGSRADPAFRTRGFLTQVGPRPYLAAVARNGSPAYTTAELATQQESIREQADGALVPVLDIRLAAATGPVPAPDRCHLVRPPGAASFATFSANAPDTLLLRSRNAASVSLRRFASFETVPVGSLDPRQLAELKLPADSYAGPWYVSVGPTKAPISVCAGG